jgi:hypothetical protein
MLTREQVDTNDLTVIQKYDARDKQYHDSVETEALSQALIVQIVRDRLDALLPEPLADILAREEEEARTAAAMAAALLIALGHFPSCAMPVPVVPQT